MDGGSVHHPGPRHGPLFCSPTGSHGQLREHLTDSPSELKFHGTGSEHHQAEGLSIPNRVKTTLTLRVSWQRLLALASWRRRSYKHVLIWSKEKHHNHVLQQQQHINMVTEGIPEPADVGRGTRLHFLSCHKPHDDVPQVPQGLQSGTCS